MGIAGGGESGGGDVGTCKGYGGIGDEPWRPSSIPLEGSKREDQRSSWTLRPCSGMCGTAASGGIHGGHARCLRGERSREGREHAREREERIGERRGRQGRSYPRRDNGGDGDLLARIDGEHAARQLLA
jgi:hypothetical protein